MTEENDPLATIIVVDDNQMNLLLLDRILRRSCYDVVLISESAKVISACETNPPDMIILDISMLKMDGHEVCESLKSNERLREIPVIFITRWIPRMIKKQYLENSDPRRQRTGSAEIFSCGSGMAGGLEPTQQAAGSSAPQNKVKALGAGGVDYITKPFQDDEILTRIGIHLKLRNLQKQLASTSKFLFSSTVLMLHPL